MLLTEPFIAENGSETSILKHSEVVQHCPAERDSITTLCWVNFLLACSQVVFIATFGLPYHSHLSYIYEKRTRFTVGGSHKSLSLRVASSFCSFSPTMKLSSYLSRCSSFFPCIPSQIAHMPITFHQYLCTNSSAVPSCSWPFWIAACVISIPTSPFWPQAN